MRNVIRNWMGVSVLLLAACSAGSDAPAAANGQGTGAQPGAEPAEVPRFMGHPPEYYVAQVADSEDSDERAQAVAALASFGPAVAGVVPALIGALADTETLVRVAANRTLGKFGSDAAPALVQALGNDPRSEVRAGTALVLGNSVGTHDGAVAALAAELNGDAALDVRVSAARGLSVGGAESVTALPALVEALEDPAPELAQWAALALGRMGPAAASAVEALERASESANRVVANAASQALRQVQQ
jgi:hypothetical protein